MKSLGSRLTYANVVATLALFLVVAGGGAYAASKIGAKDIKTGAVTTSKIRKGAVTATKLAPAALDPALAGAQGVALAGAEVDNQGKVISWFNRLGVGPPTIDQPVEGEWNLNFPGLAQQTGPFVGSATVTGPSGGVIGTPGIATTRMSGQCSGSCTNHPLVNTFDVAGHPTNLGFNYVMYGAGVGDEVGVVLRLPRMRSAERTRVRRKAALPRGAVVPLLVSMKKGSMSSSGR
jgi:hypothetical protein